MSERLVNHGETNQTPLGPAAMGLGADGKTYALPVAAGGGAVLVQEGASPVAIKTVTGSVSSNSQVIAAVASKKLKIQYVKLRTAYGGAVLNPVLTDGNGGTTLWDDHMQALSGTLFGSNEGVSAPSYLFSTSAGNALYLNPGGQTVYYDISYWDSDAL